jgi:hypothetical protein
MGWPEIKKYYAFDSEEQSNLFLTVLAITASLFIHEWRTADLDVRAGISLFLFIFVVILVSLFIHVTFQKLISIKMGYLATYVTWMPGLALGVLISFMSQGLLPLFVTGTIILIHHERLRLGKFRYGMNLKNIGMTALAGPLANIIIVLITKPFLFAYGGLVFDRIIVYNLLIAFFSLLPIPFVMRGVLPLGKQELTIKTGSPGLHVFFWSRGVYLFFLIFVMVYSLLIIFLGVFSYILALFIAAITTAIWYAQLEKIF